MPPRALSKTKKIATAAPSKTKSSLSRANTEGASLKSKGSTIAPQKTTSSKTKQATKPAKPKATGLELALKQFRLVNPVSASDDARKEYIKNRLGGVKRGAYNAVRAPVYESDEPEDYEDDDPGTIHGCVHETVKVLEKECGFEDGVLGESVWVGNCCPDYSEEITSVPTGCETDSRIYSLATPTHIDVHFQYYHRAGISSVGWNYSLGYKIHSYGEQVPTSGRKKSHRGRPDMQSICFAHFDDDEGFRHRQWRPVEVSKFGLDKKGVLDIHEALFGPLVPLAAKANKDVVEERQRMLVRTVRILFAAVGIDYPVRCKDDEEDERLAHRGAALDWTLESSTKDQWIARGIRKACGFQLASDPKMTKARAQARMEEVMREETRLELEYRAEDDWEDEYDSDRSADWLGERYHF
ncbi:hypothetical protein BOTBODRAFT_179260 [Botryobasidium botryosum FD-172 SS1]|uniref:Uncharacterized protein n=1 Tax=Botryobasidium botryosum (strain FD-172 SS1) TaxID=930990 RepID=A0A067M0J4_BOTB1|nr:hypothetical protein BOTBODRAFT_179260 [Botryobasidium botryosum FD-172 SS1]